MDESSRHRRFEDDFLRQLEARARQLVAGKLPADQVQVEPTGEGMDAVRAELSRLRVFDREALDRLAGARSYEFRFLRRVLGGLFRTTVSRIRVRTLAPVEAILSGRSVGPVGREAVLDALARYHLLPQAIRPTGVVLASATGFTPEAKMLVEGAGPPTLVLMGGREDGGWDATLPSRVAKSPWSKLFDLETQDERIRRLMYHLDQNADLLDSRGVAAPALAEKLGMLPTEADALLRQACRRDPRLMTVNHDGVVHVCRTPFVEEGPSMSLWSRMRRFLRLKPTVGERVRELTGQRVRIEQIRAEVDRRIDTLEREEREALDLGVAATNDAVRKQAAGKLMRVRKELTRQRAQAQLFTNQIDVIGTQIHHLTLTEQGKRIALPSAQELTAQAAEAEQMMAQTAANAELANSIEVTGQTPLMAEEEAAIFEEFKQAAAGRSDAGASPVATPTTPERSASRSGATQERSNAERAPRLAEAPPAPPARGDSSKAKPEAN